MMSSSNRMKMGKFRKRSFSGNVRYFSQSMSIAIFYWQGDILAESLFDVFDEDKSGALNFYEFMLVKVTPLISLQKENGEPEFD